MSTKISKTTRAGLTIPVARSTTSLRRRTNLRVGNTASVALAAGMEYLLSEIYELAGQAATDNGKKRLTPRFVMLSMRQDEEFARFFRSTSFARSGVVPHIHAAIAAKPVRRKKGKKSKKQTSE